jgi:hypothetical protein
MICLKRKRKRAIAGRAAWINKHVGHTLPSGILLSHMGIGRWSPPLRTECRSPCPPLDRGFAFFRCPRGRSLRWPLHPFFRFWIWPLAGYEKGGWCPLGMGRIASSQWPNRSGLSMAPSVLESRACAEDRQGYFELGEAPEYPGNLCTAPSRKPGVLRVAHGTWFSPRFRMARGRCRMENLCLVHRPRAGKVGHKKSAPRGAR